MRTEGNARSARDFFDDISQSLAQALIDAYAVSDPEQAPEQLGRNLWPIVLEPARIDEFAAEDIVRYIEQEPRPLEPLNDVTRAEIRTNVVQGGSPPGYTGLTGNGIQVSIYGQRYRRYT